jgi:peptidoglycan/xylan/chitin deacetylase (PgdA/CDA1 family)
LARAKPTSDNELQQVMPSTPEILETAAGVSLTAALIAAGTIYAALAPGSRIFGSALSAPNNPAKGKPQIALTFDDGPNPCWTPQLLDILAKHNVRATFFLIGKYASTQRDLVRRIHEAGHLIGNHTWTHPNRARTSQPRTRQELTDTSNELEQITGSRVRYFRPPFGYRRPATFSIAREIGLTPVTWNAIANDWMGKPTEYITGRCTRLIDQNQSHGHATNLVLHDGSHLSLEADRSRTITAADLLINHFSTTHEFVTLNEWQS